MAPATASCSATCTATSRAGPRTCPATTARARSSTCSPACATAPRGRIGIEDKGTPGTQEQGLYPWFEVPGRVERDLKVVCGHWSALGLTITQGVHAIDTGAVWGGKLTALQLDTDELRVVQVPGRDVPAPVPNARPPARPAHERPAAATQGKEQGGNAAATPATVAHAAVAVVVAEGRRGWRHQQQSPPQA